MNATDDIAVPFTRILDLLSNQFAKLQSHCMKQAPKASRDREPWCNAETSAAQAIFTNSQTKETPVFNCFSESAFFANCYHPTQTAFTKPAKFSVPFNITAW
jgi:hypothetical protein